MQSCKISMDTSIQFRNTRLIISHGEINQRLCNCYETMRTTCLMKVCQTFCFLLKLFGPKKSESGKVSFFLRIKPFDLWLYRLYFFLFGVNWHLCFRGKFTACRLMLLAPCNGIVKRQASPKMIFGSNHFFNRTRNHWKQPWWFLCVKVLVKHFVSSTKSFQIYPFFSFFPQKFDETKVMRMFDAFLQ